MQRLYTIEVRVDFKDDAKQEVMERAMQQAARLVFSNGELLSDHIKPQVVLYSHDYFSGHKDIPLITDDVATGTTAIGGKPGEDGVGVQEDPVSPEMLAALKEAAKA